MNRSQEHGSWVSLSMVGCIRRCTNAYLQVWQVERLRDHLIFILNFRFCETQSACNRGHINFCYIFVSSPSEYESMLFEISLFLKGGNIAKYWKNNSSVYGHRRNFPVELSKSVLSGSSQKNKILDSWILSQVEWRTVKECLFLSRLDYKQLAYRSPEQQISEKNLVENFSQFWCIYSTFKNEMTNSL